VPAPQFPVADRPRDRHGPQLLQLGLQSSRYSRAGLAQSVLPFSLEALGWLARVHGLADPREFREPAGSPWD